MPRTPEKTAETLRDFALGLPGAHEDFPWGERVVKVNKKIFVFLGKSLEPGEPLGFCVKLPESAEDALQLSYTQPAGYGMGKYGWVLVQLPAGESPPVDMFLRWIEESYRSIAPKKLLAQCERPSEGPDVVCKRPKGPKRRSK
jgi:predicted DNA-binding protein (MmcQ/YjbR family)